ncbi:hypothetical protein [Polyangium mundeleinium]|uniref:Uncharacterized protein n=1 Tax=Polyangium mundeleinium TaxID=2995306 RepID=A0ABT5ETZ8_9BACT|nr:hypothetical protein [Polyangium mundeleinium]MDC0744387.1 hypothetical protein [Polyangium mundeleinium]
MIGAPSLPSGIVDAGRARRWGRTRAGVVVTVLSVLVLLGVFFGVEGGCFAAALTRGMHSGRRAVPQAARFVSSGGRRFEAAPLASSGLHRHPPPGAVQEWGDLPSQSSLLSTRSRTSEANAPAIDPPTGALPWTSTRIEGRRLHAEERAQALAHRREEAGCFLERRTPHPARAPPRPSQGST